MTLSENPKRSARASKPYGAEQAREEILRKARKGGAKGVSGFFTPKTPEAKRTALAEALAALEAEGAIVADRRKAKPRYHHAEFPPQFPTAEAVAAKLAAAADQRPQELLNVAELKRALARDERDLLEEGIRVAVERGWLLELQRKKAAFYVGAGPVREVLGSEALAVDIAPQVNETAIREAYDALVRDGGFSDVPISALQAACGVALEALKEWLVARHRQGEATLSFGDWSLADETRRAAAVEMGGEKYLLARLVEF